MKRIIYCSRATRPLSSEQLVSLLAQAREDNRASGITGLLLYSHQSFLQLIDGDNKEIDRLYGSIARDARHDRLRLLLDTEISARKYPDWTMGFAHLNDDDLARDLEGFTPAIEYPLVNPELIANATVAETLLDLYSKNRTG